MSAEVSLAEFEYFRDERIPLDAIQMGSRLLLFACLVEIPVTPQQKELVDLRVAAGQQYFYGKTECEITDISLPPPQYADIIAPFVDGKLVQVDYRYPVMLKVGAKDMLFADTPTTTASLYEGFYHSMSERNWGHHGVQSRGIKMVDGYLVDPENSDNPILASQLVATSGEGDDDGSAGALVPNHPKSSPPSIQREIPVE